jgi:hypothetical protein
MTVQVAATQALVEAQPGAMAMEAQAVTMKWW